MIVGRQDARLGMYPTIVLQDKTVGRRHAEIRLQNGQYILEDLSSLNKTRVNGVALPPKQEYPLQDKDLLQFGSVEVRFEQ